MSVFNRFTALRWIYNVIVPPRYRDKLAITEELCALERTLNKVIDVTNANGQALEAITKDLEDIQLGTGGYYSPTITDNGDGTITLSFVASDVSMPPIEDKTFFLGDMQSITEMLQGFNGDPMEVKNYIDNMSGGYYTPVFEQNGNTVEVSFVASNTMLPALDRYSLTLPVGPSGKSAYEVAVDNGFKGSVEDFFASLRGDTGKSAYQYAKEGGYDGTETDFAKQLAIEIKFDNGNLFNKAEATVGYYLSGNGTLKADVNSAVTGFIAVKPNTTYTRSAATTDYPVHEYDSTQTRKRTISGVSFTTSADCYFIRTTIAIGQTPIDTYMIVEGSTLPSGYLPYGPSLRIAGQNVAIDTTNSNLPLFSKLGVLGDSLSNQEKWQSTACAIANISEWHKNAITGSWVADYGNATLTPFVSRYLDTPEDCDCITIMGGTNDANAQNGQNMGEVGVCNNNTFKGAYSTIIEGLLARNPGVRIMLITPPRSYTTENTINEKIKPYAEATKEIAKYYGLPCLDLYNTLGINDKTFTYILYDNVHFSTEGGLRVGRLIGNFIRNNY